MCALCVVAFDYVGLSCCTAIISTEQTLKFCVTRKRRHQTKPKRKQTKRTNEWNGKWKICITATEAGAVQSIIHRSDWNERHQFPPSSIEYYEHALCENLPYCIGSIGWKMQALCIRWIEPKRENLSNFHMKLFFRVYLIQYGDMATYIYIHRCYG